jgi:uncharacterized protein
MSGPEFAALFGLGLVSSVHCLGMCGPIVLAYSLPLGTKPWLGHFFYNAGRLSTYTVLGALAGLIGGGMGMMGKLAGVENIAMLVAGGLMVIAGVLMLDVLPSTGLVQIGGGGIPSAYARFVGRFLMSPQPVSKLRLGLVLGFLPCGLIYAALLKAMETGSALDGALTMLAFGLGTAGALLGTGFVSSAVRQRFGAWSNRLAGVSVVILGALLLYKGIVLLLAKKACPLHAAL